MQRVTANALSAPFEQLERYVKYISNAAPFGTHQGVKGLEFDRVMVVFSDEEAKGFLFGCDKLLGGKPPGESDLKNLSEGKETSIDRTRRLFYVTCSRAISSLALVMYSSNPTGVKEYLTGNG